MSNTEIARRDFLKMAGLTTAGLALTGCQMLKSAGESQERPNVVVVFTDDQRWDCLGVAPKPLLGMKTPHLDRLAKEGALFENMFVTTSLCSPSRASFLSGLYAHSHGVM
ncbi:MAG: twin-arginine translocation signal domain-containing protein, partial [Planctomycetota bacterium]